MTDLLLAPQPIELVRVRSEAAVAVPTDPSFEAVRYRPGQAPRNLAQDNDGPTGGLNSVPGVAQRNITWTNGQCVASLNGPSGCGS